MHEKNRQMLGILICSIIGIVILLASLLYSEVDQTPIKGGEMIDFGGDWQINVENKSYYHVQLPSYLQNVTLGETLVMNKRLPSNIDEHTYIFFRASHQKVKVFAEDTLIYSFGWNEKRLFSKSPACVWVAAPLSSDLRNAQIRIELVGAYENYANRMNNVYIADKSAIVHYIVSNHLGSIFICIALVIIGFGMIGITAILHNGKITASLQRLGILAVLIGVWSTCVTNTLQILYDNVYFLLNLEFFLFNLLLPVFIWFLMSFPLYKEQKWIKIIFWVSIAQFMIVEGLQITGIADYLESIILTHAVMVFGIGYIIVTGVWDFLHRHATREVKILILSLIILMVFIGIDIVRFYQLANMDEGFYTRIGTLIFIMLWATEVIRNMSKRFVYMARTKALETLAYEDLMTGLKNRTAFEEWMRNYQSNSKDEDVYIVTFDMNGLKSINDNYGHMKGDQAIVILSKIIKEAFTSLGTTYRIGGDEICVIVLKANSIPVDKVRKKLQIIEEKVEKASNELVLDFSVAVGYSKVSSRDKKDIYEAYKEADYLMYEHKQSMKQVLAKK
jgi:diguanylate cyclase (GGDEF)-like protein